MIMEENHTFDSYFGDFPGVAGTKWGVTEPPAPNPMPHDVLHSGPKLLRHRRRSNGRFDPLGQVQYQESDIPTYWAYASQYGLGENFFSDAETSSTQTTFGHCCPDRWRFRHRRSHRMQLPAEPNRAESRQDGTESYGAPCYDINSIPQELANAGLTWKMYGENTIWNPIQYVKAISTSSAHP